MRSVRLAFFLSLIVASALAQEEASCLQCAEWNQPQEPFRIYGNTYFVGVHGLSSILVTSGEGHVLIDGALPESAEAIARSVRALGFRIEDVRLIVNSHAHWDHAGGIAELRRLSGAQVAVSRASADVFRQGRSGRDDPQFGVASPFPPVPDVRIIEDGETLRAGPLALTARLTPGHTRGGTSWTWRSREGERCLDIVYADSLTAVSADGFLYTRSADYPDALRDFARSFEILSAVPCDILITPHPGASNLFEKLERRERGERDAFIDPAACRNYASAARERLRKRVEAEKAEVEGGASR
jgi:metallo-beta-lactamase class B